MYRKKSLLILIVCVLSIFFIQNISYAHLDHAAIDGAKILLNNSVKDMSAAVGAYDYLRGSMETLISAYEANQDAIRSGYEAAFTKACVAIVAGAAAIKSGGILAPAAFVAYLAVRDAFVAGSISSQRYVNAMGTVLSLVDAALTDVNTAYSMGGTLVIPATNSDGELTGGTISVNARGYLNDYRTYLTKGAEHLPGESYETLFDKVQKNRGQVGSHSFSVISTYKHWPLKPSAPGLYTWKTWGLPNDYRCEGGGTCYVMFRSPHEAFTAHKARCQVKHTFTGLLYGEKREFQCILQQFVCNPNDDHIHDFNPGPPTYPDGYSNENGSSSSASLSSSGGSYTASAGSTHTANVSVPSGYQYVYWYIAGPGIDGLGLLKETDSGYGSSTTASFSWSIPSYTSGDHVITAYTQLSDNSIVQPSYTLSVGSGSSTDTTDTTSTDTSSTTDSDSSTASTTDDDDDDDDDDSSTASTSPYSLSISNPGKTFYSGDTVTLTLSGSESYSSVSWSVDGPLSTNISYDSGDGSSYDSSTSYTFSSRNVYKGDYVFKAIVYTAGNGTRYEHTYTITVQ